MHRATAITGIVLSIGMAGALSVLFGSTICTRSGSASVQLRMLAASVENFAIDTGQLPADLQQLLSSDVPCWDGPYGRAAALTDPWSNSFIYRVSATDELSFVVAFIAPEGVSSNYPKDRLFRTVSVGADGLLSEVDTDAHKCT